MAKSNNGAPGIDGVTFEAIEESGVESFLKQIHDELVHNMYRPMAVRRRRFRRTGAPRRSLDPHNPRPRGSGCA